MFLLQDLLRASADVRRDHTALIAADRTVTFGELDRESDGVATGLSRLGLAHGDRVGVLIGNSPELAIALFGVSKAGGVFVVSPPAIKPARLARIVDDCTPRALIAEPSASAAVAAALAACPSIEIVVWTAPPESASPSGVLLAELVQGRRVRVDAARIDQDLCGIIYTSGSTGEPKGVMLTHQNIVSTARSIVRYLENDQDDVVCCVLPMAFSYGLYQLFGMAAAGYSLVLEKSFAFPLELLKQIERHRVTGLPGVPGMFASIAQIAPQCGADLGSLRYMTNAAAPMPTVQIVRMLDLFPSVRFFSMYGQTECARACYMSPERLSQKPASVGRAIPNTELFVVDESGRRVGPGVVGELVVRGANVMRGYWGQPEATDQKLREGPIPGEKALFTGDLFRADEDGDLYFVSRTDDVIKCKGEKVAPKELEDVLCRLQEVAEAVVVGVDDPLDGQAIKAVLVLHDGATLTIERVRRHCRAHAESFMLPKFVEFRSSLPKTVSGKICRRELVNDQ